MLKLLLFLLFEKIDLAYLLIIVWPDWRLHWLSGADEAKGRWNPKEARSLPRRRPHRGRGPLAVEWRTHLSQRSLQWIHDIHGVWLRPRPTHLLGLRSGLWSGNRRTKNNKQRLCHEERKVPNKHRRKAVLRQSEYLSAHLAFAVGHRLTCAEMIL